MIENLKTGENLSIDLGIFPLRIGKGEGNIIFLSLAVEYSSPKEALFENHGLTKTSLIFTFRIFGLEYKPVLTIITVGIWDYFESLHSSTGLERCTRNK